MALRKTKTFNERLLRRITGEFIKVFHLMSMSLSIKELWMDQLREFLLVLVSDTELIHKCCSSSKSL